MESLSNSVVIDTTDLEPPDYVTNSNSSFKSGHNNNFNTTNLQQYQENSSSIANTNKSKNVDNCKSLTCQSNQIKSKSKSNKNAKKTGNIKTGTKQTQNKKSSKKGMFFVGDRFFVAR